MNQEPSALGSPSVLRRRDMRVRWDAVPGAQTPGYVRGLYTPMECSYASGRIVMLPVGQGSPKHQNTAEHLIIMLKGEATFEFPDHAEGALHRIATHDLLYIPANVDYVYWNSGEVDVLWFTVLVTAGNWPPTSSYQEGESPS